MAARAAIHEAKRRGRAMPMAEASPTKTPAASSEPIPKQTEPPGQANSSAANPTCCVGVDARTGESVRPPSRRGSRQHELPDSSGYRNRRFARHSHLVNRADDGALPEL